MDGTAHKIWDKLHLTAFLHVAATDLESSHDSQEQYPCGLRPTRKRRDSGGASD